MTTGVAGSIRVMHVVHQLHPGGMEYGVIKLVNGLSGGRVASQVCSTCPADPLMASQLDPSVPLFELSRRQGNDPRLVWALYQLFRRERPDVVHTHAWGTLLEGLVAARLARVPVVLHGEHGTLQLGARQKRAQRWAWSRVDGLLSVSSRLAERMAETVGIALDRVMVVRNGVDLARFSGVARDEARRALGVTDDLVLFGHVGRLVAVKDQAALVQAAATLKSRGVKCRVLIAGDGPLRPDLERQIAALDVADCVDLLGHRPDVERLYPALDGYVLCSRSEGMPNTILEAMASGVAVVSTQVGGADELVVPGETGLLVPPVRPDLLADALEQLATDPDQRRRMGESSRRRAHDMFSLATMIGNYQQVYERCAAKAAR